MNQEEKFKIAVAVLIHGDVYPSAINISIQRNLNRQSGSLNGPECKWRREVALGLGFKLKGFNAKLERADASAICRVCNKQLQDHERIDCFTMVLYQFCTPLLGLKSNTYYKL